MPEDPYPNLADPDLLVLAQRGDLEAFATLDLRHRDFDFRYRPSRESIKSGISTTGIAIGTFFCITIVSPDGPNMRAIRELALEHGLVSAYTSFIAIDSSQRTGGAYGATVQVPENTPRGVRYETTVGER